MLLLKNDLTNICSKISKIGIKLSVYEWFNLQYEKLWKVPTQYGKKMNILCILDRNHERSVFVLDHFRKFKGI